MSTGNESKSASVGVFQGKHVDLTMRFGIVGQSTSGKTRGLYDLMRIVDQRHRKKHGNGIQIAWGFSATENSNGNLGGPVKDNQGRVESEFSIMPPMFAHHGFDNERLQSIIDFQVSSKQAGRGRNGVIVFDDVFNLKGMKNNKLIDQLVQNGRNYKLGMFACVHSLNQFGTSMRRNLHFLVLYSLNRKESDLVYSEFAGELFQSKDELWAFWVVMKKKHPSHWALVLDVKNVAATSNRLERIFMFSSRDPRKKDEYFIPHFCDKGFWWLQFHVAKSEAEVHSDANKVFDIRRIARETQVELGEKNMRLLQKTTNAKKSKGSRGKVREEVDDGDDDGDDLGFAALRCGADTELEQCDRVMSVLKV